MPKRKCAEPVSAERVSTAERRMLLPDRLTAEELGEVMEKVREASAVGFTAIPPCSSSAPGAARSTERPSQPISGAESSRKTLPVAMPWRCASYSITGLGRAPSERSKSSYFDHERRRLTIFAKGQRVRELPIPDRAFWKDLERHILEAEAKPDHFLLCPHKRVPVGPPDKDGHRRTELRHFPEKSMSEATAHRWWYDRLAKAGIVERGVT